MQKTLIGVIVVSILIYSTVSYSKQGETCFLTKCAAGTVGKTHSSKNDHYYACPTKELAEYTNFVIGVMALTYQMTGNIPNISPDTGEPEYEGQTKEMIDNLRSDARVTTFDEAAGKCVDGENGLTVVVANNPSSGSAIWVVDRHKNNGFWMPKTNLNPVR
ncbi:MAG: hypothetical protein KGI47_06260 [Betaproteobacteria bacterium]|nr:hypothetical protein [Betaproteobacteria bacterium]MDE2621920.1 hypothetical protein [Betaproteobacteria bacterium]